MFEFARNLAEMFRAPPVMFDRARSHLPVNSRAARVLLVGVLMLATTIATVRLEPLASAGDAAPSEDDMATVSGVVVDPQGKPLAGAKVAALHGWKRFVTYPPLDKTKCDSSGRFTVAFRKSAYAIGLGPADHWKDAVIVASAEGFGLAWIRWRDIRVGQEITLSLVDDVPVLGRVVNREGRPVAGVAVKTGLLHAPNDGNLDKWLAAVRHGESIFTTANLLAGPAFYADTLSPRITVTDSDGRFQLAGLGRERVVELSFSGPTIAYLEAKLVTRPLEPFEQKLGASGRDAVTVYGTMLEVTASPDQPIEGIVRDAENGAPLPGVRVESLSFAGQDWSRPRLLGTTTDSFGHYVLTGMPKGQGNEIIAIPNDKQPYLMRKMQVPEQRGAEPARVDVDLHRGIWISGRVIDKVTQKGVLARMYYWPFRSNEFARNLPELSERYGFEDRYATRPDGAFRLVGLPGRGIVGAKSLQNQYRLGAGANEIADADEQGSFGTYDCPQSPSTRWPHGLKEVNPPPGTEDYACDLALDPGGTMTVSVVDPDDRPLTGFEADGKSATWHGFGATIQGSTFEVVELGPDETRTVVIRHNGCKLANVVSVRLADHPTGEMTAALAPAARIIGRVVDQTGVPVPAATLELHWYASEGGSRGNLGAATTDERGRFEYTNLPAGCIYNVQAQVRGDDRIYIESIKRLAPGETKDLGDIKIIGVIKPQAENEAR